MPDQTLHQIALETRHAVQGLEALIKKQRQQSKRRLVFVLAIAIPVSMIASGFMTAATVSVCFLDPSQNPTVCQVIPGYTQADERNDQLISRFERLVEVTERNDRRLRKLERRVANG